MDDYFDINNKVLKLAGMWLPPSTCKPSERIFYYVYDTVIFLYTCVFYTICECMKYNESLSDMTVFMFYIKLVITHIWGSVKLILWHYKRSQILKLLHTLRSDKKLNLYDDEKNFEPWKDSFRMNIIRTVSVTSMAGGVSIAGSIGAFATLIFNSDFLLDNQDLIPTNGTSVMTMTNPVMTNKLPYLSWIPFEYQYSRFKYFLAVLFQWHPTFQQGVLIAAFDLYYMSILSYISVQFRLVQESCKSLRRKSVEQLGITASYLEKDPVELTNQMKYEMGKIIEWIHVLIKTCSDMEDMFTYFILGQTFFSLGALCSCLFMVTTLPVLSMKFLMEFIYLTAVTTELFIYSYYGSDVTQHAQEISSALFYSDWYTSDISVKRDIMINMARLQKPIYFTIGKIHPISLDTFVSISKAAYSFCAVVKNTKIK